ncbi:MAG: hypothetical protein P8N26_04050, partial [Cyclobacteriaceae bacterium]|nr:hypothetical protein [Cyclobacteriaceae bacterium]
MPDESFEPVVNCYCGGVIEINIPRALTADQDNSNCRDFWHSTLRQEDGVYPNRMQELPFLDSLAGDPTY